MKNLQKIFSLIVVTSFCVATAVVAEDAQGKYERGAKAIAEIVQQRNTLRLMLDGLEKELSGDVELSQQQSVVDKVKVLIERIKDHNVLVDNVIEMVPAEVVASGQELGIKERVTALVAKYQETISEKDTVKKQLATDRKKIRKLEKELKGKIEEYQELYGLFVQLVQYAEDNKE